MIVWSLSLHLLAAICDDTARNRFEGSRLGGTKTEHFLHALTIGSDVCTISSGLNVARHLQPVVVGVVVCFFKGSQCSHRGFSLVFRERVLMSGSVTSISVSNQSSLFLLSFNGVRGGLAHSVAKAHGCAQIVASAKQEQSLSSLSPELTHMKATVAHVSPHISTVLHTVHRPISVIVFERKNINC